MRSGLTIYVSYHSTSYLRGQDFKTRGTLFVNVGGYGRQGLKGVGALTRGICTRGRVGFTRTRVASSFRSLGHIGVIIRVTRLGSGTLGVDYWVLYRYFNGNYGGRSFTTFNSSVSFKGGVVRLVVHKLSHSFKVRRTYKPSSLLGGTYKVLFFGLTQHYQNRGGLVCF